MEFVLENVAWRWSCNPQSGSWQLLTPTGWGFQGARLRLHCHPPGVKAFNFNLAFSRAEPLWEDAASPLGALRILHLTADNPLPGLDIRLSCAIPINFPLFLWQIHLSNNGSIPLVVDRLDLITLDPDGGKLLTSSASHQDLAFYSTGWQSWSYAGSYTASDRQRRTRLGPVRAPAEQSAPQPSRSGVFTSDMFGVLGDRLQRRGLLLGFLSQEQHFGQLQAHIGRSEPSLALWATGDDARLEPGSEMVTDWACAQAVDLADPDPFQVYLEAVARQNAVAPLPQNSPFLPAPTGWCSWYQYSTEEYTGALSAEDIHQNLHSLRRLSERMPLQVCQIDDGFETRTGDWYTFTPGFPGGVLGLSAEIRQSGLIPGLWLAPFVVDPASQLAARHPDWLLKTRTGRLANAGYFWNAFTAGLDLTHTDALDYAAQVVQTAVHHWGFSYIKLDFLHAAALPAQRRDPTLTRAQVLRRGLRALRKAAGPDTFLLGCSCPLGSAIGQVDGMRIGADTSRRWAPSFKGAGWFLKQETTLPSARNALHNSLTRSALHRRWWINDPDCLLLRPETGLSLDEVHLVATTIALSGGSLLLSDDLARLPSDRLRIAEALLPLIGKRPQVVDWFEPGSPRHVRLDLENQTGAWHILALYNWDDQPQDLLLNLDDFRLPVGRYLLRRFWSAAIGSGATADPFSLSAGQDLGFPGSPPHSVLLFSARLHQPEIPQYLGSDLHISQGLEVSAWHPAAHTVEIVLQRPGFASGQIYISLPSNPHQPVACQSLGGSIYLHPVDFTRSASLRLTW